MKFLRILAGVLLGTSLVSAQAILRTQFTTNASTAGASALVRTTAGGAPAPVTIGTGLAFDGTTLSGTGTNVSSLGVNGSTVANPNLVTGATVKLTAVSSNITATIENTNVTTHLAANITIATNVSPVLTANAFALNQTNHTILFGGTVTNAVLPSGPFLAIKPHFDLADSETYTVLRIAPTERAGANLSGLAISVGLTNSVYFSVGPGGTTIGSPLDPLSGGVLTLGSPLNTGTALTRIGFQAKDSTASTIDLGNIDTTWITNTHDLVYPAIDFKLRRTTTSPALYYRFMPDLMLGPSATFTNVVTASSFTATTDNAYGAGWNGSLRLATENSIYDKIETIIAGGNQTPWASDIDGGGFSLTNALSLSIGTAGTGSIAIGAAGVVLTDDGDGALIITGVGNGSDEAVSLNLDDTANNVVAASSTGVTNFTWTGIGHTVTSVTASGLVSGGTGGFGTTAPAEKLDISTSVTATETAASNVRFSYSADPNYYNIIANSINSTVGLQTMRFGLVNNAISVSPLTLFGNGNAIFSASVTATGTVTAATLVGAYDASVAANVLKQTKYLILQRPDYGDGAGAIPQTNSYVASGLMHFTMSGNAETNVNWTVYEFDCPADLNTAVAMTATYSFLSGGTDADAYVFHLTYEQAAVGAAYATGTTIDNLPIVMSVTPTTAANGDIQQSAATTLTGWAAALTPGLPMQVRVARLQNTQDDGSRDVSLRIAYGSTQ